MIHEDRLAGQDKFDHLNIEQKHSFHRRFRPGFDPSVDRDRVFE